jgi:outer membrane protein assembly factor BamA
MSRMKWRWAIDLRVLVGLTLLLRVTPNHAQEAASGLQHAPTSAPAPAPASQSNVTEIRVVTEDGRVLSDCPRGVSVSINKPLDRADVAASLRALYRTGDYANLRAVTTQLATGVRLDFVVTENLFFNQVIIEGLTSPPTEGGAIAAMQLNLGEIYRAAAVTDSLQRLRDVLRDEGLYLAVVTAQTVPHPATHQMDILVHIQPGPRARLGQIQLTNGTEFPDAEIIARTKIKPAAELTSARLQKGTERLRKYLIKKGHLSARAVVRKGEYDNSTNTVPLHLEVTEGPLIQMAVTGAKISKRELKRLVPIYQEAAVDTDLLEEGKRNLRERQERDGFFDARVDYQTETHPAAHNANGWQGTEETITYHINRGDRHKLVRIEIAGNQYFPKDLLQGRLQISAAAFGARSHFSQRLLDSDAQSMKNLYLSNGFLDAEVKTEVVDNYKGKTGARMVRFTVSEGPQTSVASLAIDGVHAFKQQELLDVVGSVPGQPYSEANVATDRDNILALYFNEGYPEATFTSTAVRVSAAPPQNINAASSEADARAASEQAANKPHGIQLPAVQAEPVKLVYQIQEGPETLIRNVLLTGYRHTRRNVIQREVRVKPHEPLRQGDVVESQRRLYNLGVFNRVTIAPQNPNGTDPDKDLVVLVEEAKRFTIAYGGGFEVQRLASTNPSSPTGSELQAAPRGIFEITRNNLTGRGDSLSLRVRGSTIEDRILLNYTHPNLFSDSHLSLQASAYTEKSQDINTFTENRYEGSLQLTQTVSSHTTFVYRYVFRKVQVSNLNEHVLPEEIPLFEQPTLVSEVGGTWIHDTRDNPAEATKGTFNSFDFAVADTVLGSSASFLRFFYQNSTYYRINSRFSFARSIRIGVLEPFRNTVSLSFPSPEGPVLPELIPLPERFFAGGGTSIRGFALNQAGPRDSGTGFPVGGQALLAVNQEFRFPMRLPFIGSKLGGALFYDGGNVYSQLSHVTFRYRPPTPVFNSTNECIYNCTNELNYFSHTIGFGVRYGTPVGPIRVDLGYLVNRALFTIPVPSPNNTNSCPTVCEGTRLPKFQVFFNLGPSF